MLKLSQLLRIFSFKIEFRTKITSISKLISVMVLDIRNKNYKLLNECVLNIVPKSVNFVRALKLIYTAKGRSNLRPPFITSGIR